MAIDGGKGNGIIAVHLHYDAGIADFGLLFTAVVCETGLVDGDGGRPVTRRIVIGVARDGRRTAEVKLLDGLDIHQDRLVALGVRIFVRNLYVIVSRSVGRNV